MEEVNNNYVLIIGGVLAIIAELVLGVATGFDLLIIGVVFIISGGIGLAANSFTTALIAAVILSLGYVLFGRKFVKDKISISTKATNTDALIGKKGIVVKAIKEGKAGQVKVDGEIWRAEGKSAIDEGSSVRVESVSGVTLSVTLSS